MSAFVKFQRKVIGICEKCEPLARIFVYADWLRSDAILDQPCRGLGKVINFKCKMPKPARFRSGYPGRRIGEGEKFYAVTVSQCQVKLE